MNARTIFLIRRIKNGICPAVEAVSLSMTRDLFASAVEQNVSDRTSSIYNCTYRLARNKVR